jgi:hypothetical protein
MLGTSEKFVEVNAAAYIVADQHMINFERTMEQ